MALKHPENQGLWFLGISVDSMPDPDPTCLGLPNTTVERDEMANLNRGLGVRADSRTTKGSGIDHKYNIPKTTLLGAKEARQSMACAWGLEYVDSYL